MTTTLLQEVGYRKSRDIDGMVIRLCFPLRCHRTKTLNINMYRPEVGLSHVYRSTVGLRPIFSECYMSYTRNARNRRPFWCIPLMAAATYDAADFSAYCSLGERDEISPSPDE